MPSLTQCFNYARAWHIVTKRQNALLRAIRKSDLPGVLKAFKDGANPESGAFMPDRPLAVALRAGDVTIFNHVLSRLKNFGPDYFYNTKIIQNDENSHNQILSTSYLYAAIELDQKDIALALAQHSAVDPTYTGRKKTYSTYSLNSIHSEEIHDSAMIGMALQKNMPAVAAILGERTLEFRRAEALEQADEAEKQARALMEKARDLRARYAPKP